MIEVKPLEAIVYNQEKVDIQKVIAPPYDVIADDYKEELYKRSQYNVTRLILPDGSNNLNSPDNRYEVAARTFCKWLEEKILVKVDKPCILYVVQKYNYKGREIIRKGFIAKNRLEEFSTGNVLPHEYTMSGPKEDRLNLTKRCKANFSQIFMVYSDPDYTIENAVDTTQKPFIDVVDDGGVRNTVYKIEDEKTLKLIEDTMRDKTLLIADGHHRYETALNYSKINPQAQYVMSYFTNLEDDLLIFPTHRIITSKRIEPYDLLEKVKKYFDVEEFIFDGKNKKEVKERFLSDIEKANSKQISMGLYMKNVNKFYLLKLRENVETILEEYKVPEVLKNLDLIVLHKVLISKEFGFSSQEQMAQDGIKYIKQEEEAFNMIDSGRAEASFIMAYPRVSDVKKVSEAGERMPQKSTYFYPKLLSGIVINPLN